MSDLNRMPIIQSGPTPDVKSHGYDDEQASPGRSYGRPRQPGEITSMQDPDLVLGLRHKPEMSEAHSRSYDDVDSPSRGRSMRSEFAPGYFINRDIRRQVESGSQEVSRDTGASRDFGADRDAGESRDTGANRDTGSRSGRSVGDMGLSDRGPASGKDNLGPEF